METQAVDLLAKRGRGGWGELRDGDGHTETLVGPTLLCVK